MCLCTRPEAGLWRTKPSLHRPHPSQSPTPLTHFGPLFLIWSWQQLGWWLDRKWTRSTLTCAGLHSPILMPVWASLRSQTHTHYISWLAYKQKPICSESDKFKKKKIIICLLCKKQKVKKKLKLQNIVIWSNQGLHSDRWRLPLLLPYRCFKLKGSGA